MKRLQNSRTWLSGGAVAALLIVAVGWLMFIGPELSSTTTLHDQAAATLQQNALLQQKVQTLQAKSLHRAKYVAALRAALLAVPSDSGLPAFTRELSAEARANKVTVTSVVVGAIAPVVSAVVAATDAAGTAAVATTSAATTSAAAATPSTSTTAPASGAPVTSAAPASLLSVQVTIMSQGELTHQLAFLNDVRISGARRVLVNSAQISPGGGKNTSIAGVASFNTQLTIFSAPQTPDQVAQLKQLLNGNVGN